MAIDNEASEKQKPKPLFWVALLAPFIVAVIAWLVRRWRRPTPRPTPESQIELTFLPEIQGLSEAEAAARFVEGQDNHVQLRPTRTFKEMWADNAYSIFNLSLVGLALLQLLFGRPLDALMSLGVLLLNIGVNIFQERFAQFRMRDILQAARPKATVIRDSKAFSIDANQIVPGDVLVIGPGDQLPVDGVLIGDSQILVDETLTQGKDALLIKSSGEPVFAGSISMGGKGLCEVQYVGNQRRITNVIRQSRQYKESLTPIEHIIDRILKVLLIIVALYSILLISIYLRLDTYVPELGTITIEVLLDAANVVFSIAPAGLFFMIILTYASSTADLVNIGALVRRARSVESLAQVDVICFAQAGVLTGTRVELEAVVDAPVEEQISETRLRQILGDFARSISLDHPTIRAIQGNYEGNRRPVVDEVPFLAILGWCALVFDESDLEGAFVLGKPEILEPWLAINGKTRLDASDKQAPAYRQVIGRIRGVFKRSDSNKTPKKEYPTTEQLEQTPVTEQPERLKQADTEPSDLEPVRKKNIFNRLLSQVNNLIQRNKSGAAKDDQSDTLKSEAEELLLAYSPLPAELYDEAGLPRLPANLALLCRLHYTEQVRPEAIETLKVFIDNGVSIKIFTAGNPLQTAQLLTQAGFSHPKNISLKTISWSELTKLASGDFNQSIEMHTIIGDLNPAQAAQVVDSLREDGHHVAVVGDSAHDVLILRQADLPIALQTSSLAAISQADMILLKASPKALQRVLDKGQRIVSGLLDILKLYLTQVFYLSLLILAVQVVAYGFPYKSIQGSVIAALTLTLPSLALAIWAQPGVLHSTNLGKMLTRFTLPAALTIATAAMIVYRYFLYTYADLTYAQLAATYFLVASGLILVLFIKPPGRGWSGGLGIVHDPRLIGVVVLGALGFLLAIAIPFVRELLELDWLRSTQDYLFIAFVLGWWAITLQFIWRVWPLRPLVKPARYIPKRIITPS